MPATKVHVDVRAVGATNVFSPSILAGSLSFLALTLLFVGLAVAALVAQQLQYLRETYITLAALGVAAVMVILILPAWTLFSIAKAVGHRGATVGRALRTAMVMLPVLVGVFWAGLYLQSSDLIKPHIPDPAKHWIPFLPFALTLIFFWICFGWGMRAPFFRTLVAGIYGWILPCTALWAIYTYLPKLPQAAQTQTAHAAQLGIAWLNLHQLDDALDAYRRNNNDKLPERIRYLVIRNDDTESNDLPPLLTLYPLGKVRADLELAAPWLDADRSVGLAHYAPIDELLIAHGPALTTPIWPGWDGTAQADSPTLLHPVLLGSGKARLIDRAELDERLNATRERIRAIQQRDQNHTTNQNTTPMAPNTDN